MDAAKVTDPAAPHNKHEGIGTVFQLGDCVKRLIAAVVTFVAFALTNLLDRMLP